tara:strand:- start:1092 stop:1268 length:177 start_codon:yes stop_codon:yes gene_type:complete
MTAKWLKEVTQWEKQYLNMVKDLTPRQIEILKGDDIKTHEGCMYGQMYVDWKRRKEAA